MRIFHEKLKGCIPDAAPASSISMFGHRLAQSEPEFTIDIYRGLYGKSAYQACLNTGLFTPEVITSMQDAYTGFFMKALNSSTPKDDTNEYYARQCFLRGFRYALANDENADQIFTNVTNQLSDIDTTRLLGGKAAKVSVKPEYTKVLLTPEERCILENILSNRNVDTRARLLEAFKQASTHQNPHLPSLTDYAVNIIEAGGSMRKPLLNADYLETLSELISPTQLTLRKTDAHATENSMLLTVFIDEEITCYGRALYDSINSFSRQLTRDGQHSPENEKAMNKLISTITRAEQHLIESLYQPKDTLEDNMALLEDIDRTIDIMKKKPKKIISKEMGTYRSQMQERVNSIVKSLQSQKDNINDRQDTLRAEAALALLRTISPKNSQLVAAIKGNLAEVISMLEGTSFAQETSNTASRSSTPESGIEDSANSSHSPNM